MQRFHHRQFADVNALVALKKTHRIAVCIPTLNEADTIGPIVATIHEKLVRNAGLVDEILVIDSGSTDATCEIAAAAGAQTGEGTRSTATQVRELSRMAEELRQSVSRFKIA